MVSPRENDYRAGDYGSIGVISPSYSRSHLYLDEVASLTRTLQPETSLFVRMLSSNEVSRYWTRFEKTTSRPKLGIEVES